MRWLLTPSKDFSSRLTSSLPFTHTRAHTSSVPSLPPSLLLSGERQLDGMIHLQKSSLRHVLLEFPGSCRSRVSNVEEVRGGSGRKRRSFEPSQCPPPRKTPVFLGFGAPVLRRVPLVSSWRLCAVNSSPLSSNSWPAAASQSRLGVLRGRAPRSPPAAPLGIVCWKEGKPSAVPRSPAVRWHCHHLEGANFNVEHERERENTSERERAGVACITSLKAEGEEKSGKGVRKQIQITQENKPKTIKASYQRPTPGSVVSKYTSGNL